MLSDRRLYERTISLQCVEAAPFEHITLEMAKLHARVDADEDDVLISAMIVAARQAAEGKTHRTLCESVWEWKFRGCRGRFEIPATPCFEMISLGREEEILSPGDYRFTPSSPGGQTSPLYAWIDMENDSGGEFVATFKAGYPQGECPEAIIQWMLVKISSFYDQRESFAIGTFNELSRNFVDHLLDSYIVM